MKILGSVPTLPATSTEWNETNFVVRDCYKSRSGHEGLPMMEFPLGIFGISLSHVSVYTKYKLRVSRVINY
jgi:hypothetical protein